MSTQLRYRILNVFTIGDDPFSGNPLCVFEDARELTDDQLQNLARQLNLSETTFVSPGDGAATATVRIFTPTFEMPFAGHPTLGTAHVVRDLVEAGDAVVLRMPAGEIGVRADGDTWTLQANRPTMREVIASGEDVARTVGLPSSSLAAQPLWVDAGVEQLIVPLRSAVDVRTARPDPMLLREYGTGAQGEALVYIWAPTGPETIESRFFFMQGSSAIEDPATGSACANLGGWFLANGELGIQRRILQGSATLRPSLLDLSVDEDGTVFVSGTVRERGRGTLSI